MKLEYHGLINAKKKYGEIPEKTVAPITYKRVHKKGDIKSCHAR